MALYLMNTKGKKDFRLITADNRNQADQHFIGKHDIDARTITDPSEGAELAARYPLEKAGEPVPEQKQEGGSGEESGEDAGDKGGKPEGDGGDKK